MVLHFYCYACFSQRESASDGWISFAVPKQLSSSKQISISTTEVCFIIYPNRKGVVYIMRRANFSTYILDCYALYECLAHQRFSVVRTVPGIYVGLCAQNALRISSVSSCSSWEENGSWTAANTQLPFYCLVTSVKRKRSIRHCSKSRITEDLVDPHS